MFSSIAHKTQFWSFTSKRSCVVCALNCAQILVVRALDCAQFLLHPALFPTLSIMPLSIMKILKPYLHCFNRDQIIKFDVDGRLAQKSIVAFADVDLTECSHMIKHVTRLATCLRQPSQNNTIYTYSSRALVDLKTFDKKC